MADRKDKDGGEFIISNNDNRFYLGIDIGTTSAKVCLIDNQGEIVSQHSKVTEANINKDNVNFDEAVQSVVAILEAVEECIQRFTKSSLAKVKSIGICGQMHGVCMWKYHQNHNLTGSKISCKNYWKTSDLYTWMDKRCDSEFLRSLPLPQSHLKVSTGHGCATLFWLSKYSPSEIKNYDSAGTIMDYLVAMLCDLSKPIMSNQNAASWGYFDTVKNEFNIPILEAVNFPVHLLPHIGPAGQIVGRLQFPWIGIEPGCSVGIASGDLQCFAYSTLSHYKLKQHFSGSDDFGFVNISTSAQIGYIVPAPDDKSAPGVEYFPYFDGYYLAVGASLNGGNVLSSYVDSILNLLEEFDTHVTKDKAWEKIMTAGNATLGTDLTVSAILFGERHCPEAKASISNISPSNSGLGHLMRALCKGLIDNLAQFISPEDLLQKGINSIVASGTALNRNPILQQELRKRFNLDVVLNESDAAFGVAQLCRSKIK